MVLLPWCLCQKDSSSWALFSPRGPLDHPSPAQLLPTPWPSCSLPGHCWVTRTTCSQRQSESVAIVVYRSRFDNLFSLKKAIHKGQRECLWCHPCSPCQASDLSHQKGFPSFELIEICISLKYWTTSSRGLCLLIIKVRLDCLHTAGVKNHC